MPLTIHRAYKKLLAQHEGFGNIVLSTKEDLDASLAALRSVYATNRELDDNLTPLRAAIANDSEKLNQARGNITLLLNEWERISSALSAISTTLAGAKFPRRLSAITESTNAYENSSILFTTVPHGKLLAGIAHISGIKDDGSSAARYIRQFAIKNNGQVSLVGPVTTIGEDEASGTRVNILAHGGGNDGHMLLEVVSPAGERWAWSASIDINEVSLPPI